MNAVHVTSSVSRLAGGLFVSVPHLMRSINAAGQVKLQVLGLQDAKTAEDMAAWIPLEVRAYPVAGPERFGYAPGMIGDLLDSKPDLVHLHGLWKYPSLAVLRWARRTRKPFIVSPHGMLEPWSLQQSRVFKKFASALYQGSCLRDATCIRATSALEAKSIRLAGYSNRIALIPNGVKLPETPLARPPQQPNQRRRALFLSRIHPKKGLLNLVEAWRAIDPPGWELVIAGPDEGGHLADVKALVAALGLSERIVFCGEVLGDAKTRLYCESDLFVLPSFSENFGLVIAEALSCELPVITTRATPWQELEEHRCGWWIEVGVKPLIRSLREAMSLPPEALREMGVRGRELVQKRYGWKSIGVTMFKVYEWMLGREPKPDCVIEG